MDPIKPCQPPPNRDYTRFLKPDALAGARIGIPRAFYYERIVPPGLNEPRGGLNPDQAGVMREAIEVLRQNGAIIVDQADIPAAVPMVAKATMLSAPWCSSTA